MMKEHGIEVFEKALRILDSKLAKLDKSITIRAIGGFAMLYNGITEHGFTMDIDSLTEDFDDVVVKAISEVGEECGLDTNWLNNDCAMLEGFLGELSDRINWTDTMYELQRITLYVADYVGLIRSKAKAVHDGGLVPRKTDKRDLMLLLKMGNINTISEVDNDSKIGFIREEYSRTYDCLKEQSVW